MWLVSLVIVLSLLLVVSAASADEPPERDTSDARTIELEGGAITDSEIDPEDQDNL